MVGDDRFAISNTLRIFLPRFWSYSHLRRLTVRCITKRNSNCNLQTRNNKAPPAMCLLWERVLFPRKLPCLASFERCVDSVKARVGTLCIFIHVCLTTTWRPYLMYLICRNDKFLFIRFMVRNASETLVRALWARAFSILPGSKMDG